MPRSDTQHHLVIPEATFGALTLVDQLTFPRNILAVQMLVTLHEQIHALGDHTDESEPLSELAPALRAAERHVTEVISVLCEDRSDTRALPGGIPEPEIGLTAPSAADSGSGSGDNGQPPRALTHRERELIEALRQGWDNTQIAHELHLKRQTVRNYLTRLYAKIGVRSRAEAIVWAYHRGLGVNG